ncbi:hypothetical protein FOMG_18813 [Fusarium oxysporum f. sp. melonis 26406]|uniref:Uncharacterized protein n=1 Tax=Fusarium oxysporum f. sp. melonis 26406 TaxID=1089452 RepID=W9YZ94_FUSOX|nr:hypothetical protein FOMG_18813 [Fusarium oxysporum f. sp. melonis 26406]
MFSIYATCISSASLYFLLERPWRAWRATSPRSSLAERSWGLEARSAKTVPYHTLPCTRPTVKVLSSMAS